jgi:hypothetical protein
VNWDLLLILGLLWAVGSAALILAMLVLPRQISRRRMWRQINAAHERAIRAWYLR